MLMRLGGNVVTLFLDLYSVFKSIEQLYFDSPAEIDVVRVSNPRPPARISARVILVLGECNWNTSAVSLILPAFDDTGSLGSPLRQVVYPPG